MPIATAAELRSGLDPSTLLRVGSRGRPTIKNEKSRPSKIWAGFVKKSDDAGTHSDTEQI